jgi:hypothetical protein
VHELAGTEVADSDWLGVVMVRWVATRAQNNISHIKGIRLIVLSVDTEDMVLIDTIHLSVGLELKYGKILMS